MRNETGHRIGPCFTEPVPRPTRGRGGSACPGSSGGVGLGRRKEHLHPSPVPCNDTWIFRPFQPPPYYLLLQRGAWPTQSVALPLRTGRGVRGVAPHRREGFGWAGKDPDPAEGARPSGVHTTAQGNRNRYGTALRVCPIWCHLGGSFCSGCPIRQTNVGKEGSDERRVWMVRERPLIGRIRFHIVKVDF